MRIVVIVLVAWFLLSIPVAIVVGKYLNRLYLPEEWKGSDAIDPLRSTARRSSVRAEVVQGKGRQ